MPYTFLGFIGRKSYKNFLQNIVKNATSTELEEHWPNLFERTYYG